MRLRAATDADIPSLVALINAAYRVEAFFIRGDRISEAELRSLLQAEATSILLLEEGPGSPVATVCADIRGGTGHFALLAVDPAYQGRGLARSLIHAVEAHCRRAGCTALELEVFDVRRELPPFYRSCGFAETGQRAFSKPELLRRPAHLVLMRKPL